METRLDGALPVAQVVRERCDEIAALRGQGVPWRTVCKRIGLPEGSAAAISNQYHREIARRRDPDRAPVYRWLHDNFALLEPLVDQGFGWIDILALVPPACDVYAWDPRLEKVPAEFAALRARQPAVHAAASSGIARTGPDRSAPDPGRFGPPSGTAAPALPGGKRRFPHGPAPRYDPYLSAAELIAKRRAVEAERDRFRRLEVDADGADRDRFRCLGDAAEAEREQLRADFDHRFSDHRATRSKLRILSSCALSCGAFVIGNASDAIVLSGLDRPEGVEELAAVSIKENLAPAEVARIEAARSAYAASLLALGEDAPPLTPLRRLAESLLVRGEYLIRGGWHAFDSMVKLTGDDFPSPRLSGAHPRQVAWRSVTLYPRLTGDEPVQPPEWERALPTWRLDPELSALGEWS